MKDRKSHTFSLKKILRVFLTLVFLFNSVFIPSSVKAIPPAGAGQLSFSSPSSGTFDASIQEVKSFLIPQIDKDGLLVIDLNTISGSTNYDYELSVKDFNDNEVCFFEDTALNSVECYLPKSGIYYIDLGLDSFNIISNADQTFQIALNYTEDDHGSDSSTASPITLLDQQTQIISGLKTRSSHIAPVNQDDDIDFFELNIPSEGVLLITRLPKTAGSSVKPGLNSLKFYDNNNNEISLETDPTETFAGNSKTRYHIYIPNGGTYYLSSNPYGSDESYRLELDYSSDIISRDSSQASEMPNTPIPELANVPIPWGRLEDKLVSEKDVDWFKINAPINGTLQLKSKLGIPHKVTLIREIDLANESPLSPKASQVFPLDPSLSGALTREKIPLIKERVDAGNYYIKVEFEKTDSEPPIDIRNIDKNYSIIVNFHPGNLPLDDHHSNTIANATPMGLNSFSIGEFHDANDIDYYQIDVNQAGLLKVSTQASAANFTFIHDQNGQAVAMSDLSHSQVSFSQGYTSEFYISNPGTYYIGTFGYFPSSSGSSGGSTINSYIQGKLTSYLANVFGVSAQVGALFTTLKILDILGFINSNNGEGAYLLETSFDTNATPPQNQNTGGGNSNTNLPSQNDPIFQNPLSPNILITDSFQDSDDSKFYVIQTNNSGVLLLKTAGEFMDLTVHQVNSDGTYTALSNSITFPTDEYFLNGGNGSQDPTPSIELLLSSGTYLIEAKAKTLSTSPNTLARAGSFSIITKYLTINQASTDYHSENPNGASLINPKIISNQASIQSPIQDSEGIVIGKFNNSGDKDYFQIDVSGPGVLYIDTPNLSHSVGSFAYLYDNSNQNILDIGVFGTSSSSNRVPIKYCVPQGSHTYYLLNEGAYPGDIGFPSEITNLSKAARILGDLNYYFSLITGFPRYMEDGNYLLNASFEQNASCDDNNGLIVDDSSNNNSNQITIDTTNAETINDQVGSSSVKFHTFSSNNNQKFYKFTTLKSGLATLYFNPSENQNFVMHLTDDQGNILAFNSNALSLLSSDIALNHYLPNPGTYYISIEKLPFISSTQNITSLSFDFYIDDYNDSPDDAFVLSDVNTSVRGRFIDEKDKDYFKIRVQEAGDLLIKTTSGAPMEITLFKIDSSGTPTNLQSEDFPTKDGTLFNTSIIKEQNLQDTTYLIEAKAANHVLLNLSGSFIGGTEPGLEKDYEIIVNFHKSGGVNDGPPGPNIFNARTIDANSLSIVEYEDSDDVNYFKVHLDPGELRIGTQGDNLGTLFSGTYGIFHNNDRSLEHIGFLQHIPDPLSSNPPDAQYTNNSSIFSLIPRRIQITNSGDYYIGLQGVFNDSIDINGDVLSSFLGVIGKVPVVGSVANLFQSLFDLNQRKSQALKLQHIPSGNNANTGSSDTNLTLSKNSISTLEWVFEEPGTDWNTSSGNGVGDGGHKGDDYYSDDWNYKDGSNSDLGKNLKATGSGTVIFVEDSRSNGDGSCTNSDYGNQIVIQLSKDSNFAIRYAHLQDVFVTLGQNLNQGDLIGTVGSSGLSGNSPCTAHLHLTLYKNINSVSSKAGQNKKAIDWLKLGQTPLTLTGSATAFAAPFLVTVPSSQNSNPPPSNQAPSASISVLSKNDLTVNFDGGGGDPDGDNNLLTYAWDFGDGNISNLEDPIHNFSSANTYNVSLTVTDSQGASTQTQTNVTVTSSNNGGTNPPAPTVASISPNTVNLQDRTTFTISGTNFRSDFEVFIPQCETPTATSFIDAQSLQITCTPDHGPGSLTVEVKEGPGITAFDTSLRVTFVDPNAGGNPPPPSGPELISVSPNSASLGAETTFTITGNNLPSQVKVHLDQCVDYNSSVLRNVSNNTVSITCTPGFGPGSGSNGLSFTAKDTSNNVISKGNGTSLKVDFLEPSGTSPVIYNITKLSPAIGGEVPSTRPIDTLLGQEHTFEIYGNNLPDSTAFFIAGCPDPSSGNTLGPEKITDCSASSSDCSHKQQFRCTPLQSIGPNLQAGVIKDMPGGLELFNFSVNFINDPSSGGGNNNGGGNSGGGNTGSPNPTVTDIDKPSIIYENQRTTLTVNGQDLPDTLVLEITGCNSMQRETAVADSTSARAFSCIPAGTGIKSLTVKTDSNQSGSIFSSSIIVNADPNGGGTNPPPPPPPANPPSVNETTVTYSKATGQYIFTINITGTDLNDTLYVNIGGRCVTNSNSITSSSSTAMTFSCNGSSIFPVGSYDVNVIDPSSGSSLDFTTIDVTNGADDHGDNLSNTTPIFLNQGVNGEIGTISDKDYFEFKAESRGKFIFESSGGTDLKASLYVKSTGNRVGNGDDNSGQGNNFKINEELLLNETYALSVFHATGGLGAYQIKVIEDPNSTHIRPPANTTNANIGEQNGAIAANETLYYKFTPSHNSNFLIETTGTAHIQAEIYDSSLAKVAEDYQGRAVRISYNFTGGETYYIYLINSDPQQTGSFTLRITDLTPPPPPTNPGDDHSDDFDTPSIIGINQTINGNIEVGQDEDVFAFKVPEHLSYTIESTGTTDVTAELYGGCLPPSNFGIAPFLIHSTENTSGNFIIEGGLDNPYGVSYCLKVKHANTAGTGAYQFKIRKTYNDLIDDHGDTKDKATNLFRNYLMRGNQEIEGNPDFFKLKVSNSERYNIRVSGDAEPDAELYLEDANGDLTLIAQDDDMGLRASTIEKDLIAGLNYFIKVIAKKKNPYIVSAHPINQTMVQDGNRFIEEAINVPLNSSVSGSFEMAGGHDPDYYKFSVNQNGAYEIELTNSSADLDTKICLFKGEKHALVACNDNGGIDAKSKLRAELNSGINYYLHVIMPGSNPPSPINYDIHFREVDDANGNLLISLPDDYLNDTSTTNLINNNDTINGRIEKGDDEDFFLINPPLNTFATLYLESDSLLELGLYNRDGVYIGANNALVPAVQPYILENNIHKNTYIVALNGGDNYYIKVSSPENNANITDYDLTLIYSSTTQADLRVVPGIHRDRAHSSHIPLATLMDISKLNLNNTVSGSVLGHMYKIKVPQTKNYVIETSGTDDPFCTLLKETGFEITSDDNSGIDNNCKIEMQLDKDKEYYLNITASNPNQTATYDLRVSELTGSILNAGDYHSDDQLFASVLLIGKEERGHLTNGDLDWFKFNVPIDASYRFIAPNTSGAISTYGAIYDSQGNLIKSGNLNHPTLPFDADLQGNETYYIKISGQGTGWYNLIFNGPNLPVGAPDEYAVNTTFAQEIKDGSTIYGEINYTNANRQHDIDTFFFRPDITGDYEITIINRLASRVPLDINLGGVLANSKTSNGAVTINATLTAGTIYYIYASSLQPQNRYDPGYYQLSVKKASGGPNQPPEARYGINPNSDLKAFETITFDGSGSFDDVFIAGYSWDFDGDGISDSSLARVDHSFNSPGTKTISLTVSDTDGLTDTASFDLELKLPDDDFSNDLQNPSTILLNDVVNAEFENDLDKDFFSFTTTDLGTYTINLDRSSNIFFYKLYDSNFNLLSSALPSNASNFSEQIQLDENSRYIIEVFTSNQATGTYTVQVQSPAAIPVTDDHGDDFSNATEITIGSIFDASADSATDVDTFEFTVTEDSEYVITSLGQTSISATLYDVYGNQIKQDLSQSKDGTNFLIQEQLSPGKYFFKAKESNGNSVLSYQVYVYKYTPPSGPPPADNFGQDFQSAHPVRVTREQAGIGAIDFNNASLDTGNDFIRLALDTDARTGYYKIYTTGNTDTWGVVYDAQENRIAENSGKIDPSTGGRLPNFEIYVWLEAGEQYYLRVSQGIGSGGTYNLHIEPPFYATLDDEFPGHLNNSRDFYNSVPMELDLLYSGSLQSDTDHDLFSFRPTVTGDYRITTTSSGSSTNNNVSLIGINNSQIGSHLYGIGGMRHYIAGRTYFMRASRAIPVSSGNVPLQQQNHDYTIKIELIAESVEDHPGEILVTETVDSNFVSQFSQIQVGIPLNGFFGTNVKDPFQINNFDPAGVSSQNNFLALEDIDVLLFIPERTATYDIEVFSFQGPCIYIHPGKNLGDTIDPLDRASSPNPAGRQCTGHSSNHTLNTSAQFQKDVHYFIELDHQTDRLPESYKITIKEVDPIAVVDPSDLIANSHTEAQNDTASHLTLPSLVGVTANATENLHIRDFDVYKLIVNRGGNFKFSLGTNAQVDIVMELLDASGNLLENNKPVLSANYLGEFTYTLNESDTYYLRISKEKFYEETGTFNLRVSATSAAGLDDHSNDAANASEVPFNQCTEGHLPTDDDIDQLYINPPVTGTYIVSGSTRGGCSGSSSSNDFKIRYDSFSGQPSGYTLLPSYTGSGSRTIQLQTGTKYHLQYSVCPGCQGVGNRFFHVKYVLDPNSPINDDHPNDIAGAQANSSITGLTSGQIETAGDKDYFKFTANETGKHLIELSDANQEFRLKVFDSNGNLLATDQARDTTNLDISFPAYNLAAGEDYFIEASIKNASWIGSYKVSVIEPSSIPQSSQSEISHLEFNGSLDDLIRSQDALASNGAPLFAPGLDGDAINFDGNLTFIVLNGFTNKFYELSQCLWAKSNTGYTSNIDKTLLSTLSVTNSLSLSGDGHISQEASTINNTETSNMASNIDIEKWHHYCQTIKSNSEAKIYLDGALVNSKPLLGAIEAGITGFLIANNDQNKFNGFIDEFRAFDYELSSQEISVLYNQLKSEAEEQNNEAPTADFTVSLNNGNVNQAIGFDASISSDPDNNIVSYEWDFDNDGNIDYQSTSPSYSYPYVNEGIYTPRLIVTDAFGETSEKVYQSITVINPLPLGFANIPSTATANTPIDINSSFVDPDGGPVSIIYDFGNNNGDALTTSNITQSTTYTYPNPGTFLISLTIIDDEGASIIQTASIIVYPEDDHGSFTNPSNLTELNPVSGATQHPSDQDWFEFTPNQDGLFLFESNTNDQIFMTVYDGSQTSVPAISGTYEDYLAFDLNAGQRYLIKLAGANQSAGNFQSSSYSLSVKHIDSQTLPMIDINQTILPGGGSNDNIIYHPLQVVDVMANGNIPNTDSSQLIKWTVRRTADYEIRVNFNSEALIIIYDDNLNILDQSLKGENNSYTYPSSLTEAETIYIRIIKLSNLAQAFSVFIEQVVNVTPTNDDAPDDSSNALDLGSIDELNPVNSNKAISYLTDVDWFKFALAGIGNLNIYTDGAIKPARPAGSDQNNWINSNLEGCLYHSSDLNTALTCSSRKNISSSGIFTQGGANFEIENFAHSTGTYYLRVKHSSILGSTNYTLNIKSSHFLDSDEGTELTPGQALNGEFETPSDLTDFLKFIPSETGTYRIDFNNGGSTEYDARVSVDIPFDVPVSAKHSYYDSYRSPSNSNSLSIEMIKGLEYGIAISAVKDPRLYNRDDAAFLNGNNLYGITITKILGRPIQLDTAYTGTFAYSGFEDNYNIYEHEIIKAGFYELHDNQAGDNFLPRYDGHVIYPAYSSIAKNPHPTGSITALQTSPTEQYGPNYPNGYLDSFGYAHPSATLQGYRFRATSNNNRLIIIPKAAFIKQYYSVNYNFSLSYDDLPDEISELDPQLDLLELNVPRQQELNDANDIDLLQFTVPSDGKYRIKNHPSLELNIKPTGHNLDNLVLTTAPNDTNWYLEIELQAGVTYNLEISKRINSPTLSYPLLTNIELTVSPDEHGNTYQNATLLSAGQGATGTLNHGANIVEADHDFFKLTIDNDDFYNFEDTQGTSIRKLYKWNTTNQDIELVQIFDGQNGFNHKYLLASEEYYLEVTTTNNNQGQGYLVPLNVWTPTNDDVSNETAGASALTISYPASTFNGTIDYEEDFDWLKITTDTSNFVSPTFEFVLSGDEGIRAEFYDNSNPPQAYHSSSPVVIETTSSNPITSQGVSLPTGEYFIKVFHSNRLLKNKNYSIKVIQPDDHPDAQGTARIGLNTVTPIQAIFNSSTDRDVFRLPISDPTRLVIRSEGNLNLAYRVHFSLQNIGGISYHNANHFFSTDRDSGNNFNIIGNTYNALGRTYYLEVYSPTGDEGTYNIILESYTPPVRPADDYPNTEAEATPILFNTEITGNLDWAFDPITFEVEDLDYFKFYVTQYGFYTFDTDTTLQLLSTNYSSTITPNAGRYLYPNRTYYLKLAHSISGGTGSYRFKVNPPTAVSSDGSFGTASFTRSPNTDVSIGTSVDFDASTSTMHTGAITQYEWDFDGDGSIDETKSTTSTSHTFNTVGTFNVTLTVSNATDSATSSQTIRVAPADDHGNDSSNATALALNTATDGSIELNGDVDNFSYTANKCAVYEATLTDRDVDFRLKGPNLIPSIGVVYPAGNNTNYNPSFVLLDGETQHISVEADNLGFNGDYKITVSEKPFFTTQALPQPQAISANPNEEINFTGQRQRIPTGLPGDYEWDFDGNGTIDFSDTSNQASTRFAQPGTYRAYQYIKDCNGLSKLEQIFDITITNLHPTGDMGVLNASQYISDIFEFYTSGLNDPDGGLLTLDWDFGDGSSLTGLSDDVNITAPSHRYSSKGNFTVTLTITDDEGSSFSKTQPISVVNALPVLAPFYTSIKTTHMGAIFSGMDDPDGCIASLEWDLDNDGVYETPARIDNSFIAAQPLPGSHTNFAICPNIEPVLHHHFKDPGNYSLGVKATDNDGATATATLNYTVENLPPRGALPNIAKIYTNPTRNSFFINEEIEFYSDIYDPDDFNRPGEMTVTWNFGDGSTALSGTVDTVISGFIPQLDQANPLARPKYTYSTAGTYTVTLTATDKDGASFTTTKDITVDPRNFDDNGDTEDTATEIWLDKFMTGLLVNAGIDNPADLDVFKFKIANSAFFKLNFPNFPQGFELNQIAGSATIAPRPGNPGEFIVIGASGSEVVFEIKHSDPNFTGAYNFTVYDDFTFSGASLSPDDHEDLDLGLATAIPMTPNTVGHFPRQTGNIDYADDFDLFKLEYDAQGRPPNYVDHYGVRDLLDISINMGAGDVLYDILDENGKILVTMPRAQAGSQTIYPIYIFNAEKGKTYYIRVKGLDEQVSNIPYTLAVSYFYKNSGLPKPPITIALEGGDSNPSPNPSPAPPSPAPVNTPPVVETPEEGIPAENPLPKETEETIQTEEPIVENLPFTIEGMDENKVIAQVSKLEKKVTKLDLKITETSEGSMEFIVRTKKEFRKLIKMPKKLKVDGTKNFRIKLKKRKAFIKNMKRLHNYFNTETNVLTIPILIKETSSGDLIESYIELVF